MFHLFLFKFIYIIYYKISDNKLQIKIDKLEKENK